MSSRQTERCRTALFKKDGYDFTSRNSVIYMYIYIVFNTDVIIPIATLIVRSPVCKQVIITLVILLRRRWMGKCGFLFRFVFVWGVCVCVCVCVCNITLVWTDVKIKHWLTCYRRFKAAKYVSPTFTQQYVNHPSTHPWIRHPAQLRHCHVSPMIT